MLLSHLCNLGLIVLNSQVYFDIAINSEYADLSIT